MHAAATNPAAKAALYSRARERHALRGEVDENGKKLGVGAKKIPKKSFLARPCLINDKR